MNTLFTNIKGDLLGGLTAGIVALPLALAFGVSSGLFVLEDVSMELSQSEIECYMVGVQAQPKYLMKSIFLTGKLIPEKHLFDSSEECENWIVIQQRKTNK